MKITYLKLKNFANIYTAMNLKEIEIDLSKSTNTIIILDGPNGSGKTSILSMLHPFAYVGSLDVRNNAKLLLDGEDGYKEIEIINKKDKYTIQHYYKNSDTRGITLKSFIQKNGSELNINGNVTSFIEIVKKELTMEPDLLRLIRLGSNVSNLIDMKASDRKNYTAYLLSDIDIYTSLFKKINDDNRLIKNLMKSVTDKLEKLQIVDISITNKEIKDMEETLDNLNKNKNELINSRGVVNGKISTIAPEGIKNLLSTQETLHSEIDSIKGIINKNLQLIKSSCIILTDNISVQINSATHDIQNIESKINSLLEMNLFYKEQLSSLYNDRDIINTKISTFSSDVEYSQITTFHVELKLKLKDMKKKYESYEKLCTKEELIMILNTVNQINSIITEIYGFNNKSIKKTIELLKSNTDIDSYVNKELNIVNKKILKVTSQFKSGVLNNPLVIFKPQNCEIPDCPYLYLYDLLFSDSEEKTSLTSLESEKEMLNDILNVEKNIKYVFMTLKSNIDIIVKGQLNFLTVDNIINTINEGTLLDYEDYLTNLIAEVEEYDNYINAKDECKKIEDEIKLINANKGNIEELTSQLKEKDNKIHDINKIIYTNDLTVKDLSSEKESLENLLEDYNKYKDRTSIINDYTNILGQKVKDLVDIEESINKVNDLVKDINIIDTSIKEKEWSINKLSKELIDKKFSVKEFDNLTHEQEVLNGTFDELNIIKDSLSSNKGIPLLFIQLYLKSTKLYVNNLLSKIYDNFEIDDFDINENEFNIPYIKNELRIGDVSYASQGEKSFLSIAISFALIIQSIKEYNIPLLDEVDGPLDAKNKAMFLTILENWIDVVKCEQVFLITHNNMFDDYPVDVISTSKTRIEGFNNANIIFSL